MGKTRSDSQTDEMRSARARAAAPQTPMRDEPKPRMAGQALGVDKNEEEEE
jgi:hypothetical protein